MSSIQQVDNITNAAGTGAPLINGAISGTAVASGKIGEVQTFIYAGGPVTTSVGGTVVDVHSITVPIGIFLVCGDYTVESSSTTALGLGSANIVGIQFTDNSNTVLEKALFQHNVVVSNQVHFFRSHLSFRYPLALSVAATYKVRLLCNNSSANGQGGIDSDATAVGGVGRVSKIKLLRIG